ncbi:hypothetical protein HY041_00590 [Candidatus Roizmanbacteria bacterium]|nr:hypothetical protein [Candidatus Roizmanbacteria bacterium]
MTDTESKKKLIEMLYESGSIVFDISENSIQPYQIKLQNLTSQPSMLRFAANLFEPLIKEKSFDLIAGPYTDIPLATTISLEFNLPMIFVRPGRKGYGMEKLIEGYNKPDQTVAVIDDEIRNVGESLQLIGRLEGSGLKISSFNILLDRELGAIELIQKAGYLCHSVLKLNDIFVHQLQTGKISVKQSEKIKEFVQIQRSEFLSKNPGSS